MGGSPLRRTVGVLLVYVVGAWAVFRIGMWLRRVLALPPLFESMLTVGLWLGAVVAALIAWNYPSIAVDPGAGPGASERGDQVDRP